MKSPDFDMHGLDWDQDRYVAELTTEIGTLLRCATPAALEAALARSADSAETLCRGRIAACGPGCPHCCVLNVAILLPEAMVIAGWLCQRLDSTGMAQMLKRLATHSCRVRWMDDEERIHRGVVCPFLDTGGDCLIHPVRPLACRGVASLERAACERAFAPSLFVEDRTVPADLLRRMVFDAVFTAFTRALADCGLCPRSIELGTGVRAFLKIPQLAEAFLRGDDLHALWEY